MTEVSGVVGVAGPSVWADGDSLVVLAGEEVFWQSRDALPQPEQSVQRLMAGGEPRQVLGRGAKRLGLARIKSVEWVPAVQTLLVKFAWWRDPWRIKFDAPSVGEQVFGALGQRVAGGGDPAHSRVGPNDLAMDPRFGLAVMVIVIGLIAFVGGAVEGAAQAPMVGPIARFAVLADMGEAVGPAGVMAIGGLVVLAGVGGLIYWYRNRPEKLVYRGQGKRS